MDELIRKWLWMETMNFALTKIYETHRRLVFPNGYDDFRHLETNEVYRQVFAYALENFEKPGWGGCGSEHNHYAIGCDFCAMASGAKGRYRHMEILIKWPEAERFMRGMLEDRMEDRQIDLLELLAKEAIT